MSNRTDEIAAGVFTGIAGCVFAPLALAALFVAAVMNPDLGAILLALIAFAIVISLFGSVGALANTTRELQHSEEED